MRNSIIFSFLSILSIFSVGADLPNPKITPGAINSDVTQFNIMSTVCKKGYTKSIRPPANFSNKLKRRQIEQYGYANVRMKDYEEDHLIALSIGGNPTNERNLWPQPRNSQWGAAEKDHLEAVMLKMLCRNEITLSQAQSEMANDWISAYKRYVRTGSKFRDNAKVD